MTSLSLSRLINNNSCVSAAVSVRKWDDKKKHKACLFPLSKLCTGFVTDVLKHEIAEDETEDEKFSGQSEDDDDDEDDLVNAEPANKKPRLE